MGLQVTEGTGDRLLGRHLARLAGLQQDIQGLAGIDGEFQRVLLRALYKGLGQTQLVFQFAASAQALLQARKVPVTRWAPLTCTLPYALEGAVRRALDAAAVRALAVQHTDAVLMHFQAAADTAALLREQLKDIGQGQLQWVTDDDPARPGG